MRLKRKLQTHLPVHKPSDCGFQSQPQNKTYVHISLFKQSLETSQKEHSEGIEIAVPAGCLSIFNELQEKAARREQNVDESM